MLHDSIMAMKGVKARNLHTRCSRPEPSELTPPTFFGTLARYSSIEHSVRYSRLTQRANWWNAPGKKMKNRGGGEGGCVHSCNPRALAPARAFHASYRLDTPKVCGVS